MEPVSMLASSESISPNRLPVSITSNCFGARKTADGGSRASVDGELANVWCAGILRNPDEYLPNGEITFGAQPVCRDLAMDGYVAVINNKCYGKYYDPNDYYIECSGTNTLPNRLVQLNGAYAITGTIGGNYDYPETARDAKNLFEKMYNISRTQKSEYFN